MAKIIKEKGKSLYQCRECGFKYEDKDWAERRETWCKEYHTCNVEIITHAVSEK